MISLFVYAFFLEHFIKNCTTVSKNGRVRSGSHLNTLNFSLQNEVQLTFFCGENLPESKYDNFNWPKWTPKEGGEVRGSKFGKNIA